MAAPDSDTAPLLQLRRLHLVLPPEGAAMQVLGALEQTADPLTALAEHLAESSTVAVTFQSEPEGQLTIDVGDAALVCLPREGSFPGQTALQVQAVRPAPPPNGHLDVRLDQVTVRPALQSMVTDTHRLVEWGRALSGAHVAEPIALQRLVDTMEAPERTKSMARRAAYQTLELRWRCRRCQAALPAGLDRCPGCALRLDPKGRDRLLVGLVVQLTPAAARALQDVPELSLEGEDGGRLLGRVSRLDPERGQLELVGRFPEAPAARGELLPAYGQRLYQTRREALTQMIIRNPEYGLLAELVAAPQSLAAPRPAPTAGPWLSPGTRADTDQERAAQALAALIPGEAVLIQGPPGTGKTTVIVEAIRRRLRARPEERILMLSASNLAVDHALERLRDDPDLRRVRVARGERVQPGLEPFRIDPDDLERARAAQICFATVGTASISALRQLRFDLVILDEANRLRIDEALPGLHLGRALALVGDHRQLPPSLEGVTPEQGVALAAMVRAHPSTAPLLTTSIFERCWQGAPPHARHLLTLQHRMNPRIAAYVSATSYDNRLRTAPNVATQALLPGSPLAGALHFVDTGPGRRAGGERRGRSGSLSNQREVKAVGDVVRLLDRRLAPGQGMAVIAMYKDQAERLREALPPTDRRLQVGTVDAFEGREEDAVVISLVRSNERGEIGFLRLPNRLNVAVSRARRWVAVVGDRSTLAQDPLFAGLIEAAARDGGVVPAAGLAGRSRSEPTRAVS
jgi:hypothetical protein